MEINSYTNKGNATTVIGSTTMTTTANEIVDGITYVYMTGFQNQFVTEILPGAVPIGRNTPRIVPYNLYTEQLSGTAFTAPRNANQRTWLYRIQPSVASGMNASVSKRLNKFFGHCNPSDCQPIVDPIRWRPPTSKIPISNINHDGDNEQQVDSKSVHKQYDFIDGMFLMCHAGDTSTRYGLAIYQYCHVTKSMSNRHMVNTDGDFLIVPCTGTLVIQTELGQLTAAPTEIVVIPRGIHFSIQPVSSTTTEVESGAVGYVLEVYSCGGSSFHLPELGPIGSNGLANARDFYYPVAWCATLNQEEYHVPCTIIIKKDSELFTKQMDHSPYNVVGWHGNYAPYKYHLNRFCAVNSVTYDHLDPSIYTVLTCPSGVANGTALADFVLFPPRRVLATDSNTLRPPWFHRNVMSEYMGLIYGSYDAKKQGSFVPGGASLHNALTPHGPDEVSYCKAVADPCTTPIVYKGGMAFMFETCLSLKVAPAALNDLNWRDMSYVTDAWGKGLSAEQFTGWDAFS
jgi:homogentisate 1,2-dioxygenase